MEDMSQFRPYESRSERVLRDAARAKQEVERLRLQVQELLAKRAAMENDSTE